MHIFPIYGLLSFSKFISRSTTANKLRSPQRSESHLWGSSFFYFVSTQMHLCTSSTGTLTNSSVHTAAWAVFPTCQRHDGWEKPQAEVAPLTSAFLHESVVLIIFLKTILSSLIPFSPSWLALHWDFPGFFSKIYLNAGDIPISVLEFFRFPPYSPFLPGCINPLSAFCPSWVCLQPTLLLGYSIRF